MTDRFDIYAARMNAGLSQRALAEECGVSLTVIQRLENGATATPSNAKKVADYFDVQVTDLMPVTEVTR
jgi:transcriptional regulator with XRE-family HTH domain